MNEMVDFCKWVIETQGLIGFLVLVSLAQNHLYTKRIMDKNCEMERFLMRCVDRDWAKYHPGESKEGK